MEQQPIIETRPMSLPTCLDEPVTLRTLRRWSKANTKWAMLTCYDATTARWMAEAGLPTLLVGDTAAEMILGYDSTIHAPLDFLITITAAVKRGAPKCFVMGDMPFLSYQVDEASAIQNAGRFLTEGTADAVKLEVDEKWAELYYSGRAHKRGMVRFPTSGNQTVRVLVVCDYLAARYKDIICNTRIIMI